MPLFDFRCLACGREFEALVRTGYPAVCPACQSQNLEQKVSMFAVSSSERRTAAAAQARQKAAAIGRRDNVIKEAEADQHRHDEH